MLALKEVINKAKETVQSKAHKYEHVFHRADVTVHAVCYCILGVFQYHEAYLILAGVVVVAAMLHYE